MKKHILFALFFFSLCFTAKAQDLYNDSVIVKIRLEFSQPDWQVLLNQNAAAEKDIPCTLYFDGVRYDSVGSRYKGNSSLNFPGEKKPFGITMDAYKNDQNLLGYKTLNLNNGFFDPAFVREKIGYNIARNFLPAVKANYANLYINNEYWGLYLNVQQPNKTFLKEHFISDKGNSYKCDPRGDLRWYGADTLKYKKDYEKKTNEEEADWSDLVGFIEKLNNLPQQYIRDEIYKYLNVDRALWYIAFCNILSSLDSYIGTGHNYFFYNYPVDGRFNTIPWDLNEVLGVFMMQLTIPQLESLDIYYGEMHSYRPLISKLLSVPDWRKRYIAHYRTILEEVMNENFWDKEIRFFQELIRTSLEADTRKLYTMAQFDQNVNSNTQVQMGPGQRMIPGILSFVNNRVNFLRSLAEFQSDLPVVNNYLISPEFPKSSDEVYIKVNTTNTRDVNLWYSLNYKPFNVLVMTAVNGEQGAFEQVLTKQTPGTNVRFYFEVISNQTVYAYHPAHAEHQFFTYTVQPVSGTSPVVINELMASNKTAIADPQGGFADWAELYNTTSDAVDLTGKYLSDDINEPKKWIFPTGTTIAGQGYLIVWCDDDTLDTEGLHSSFKLSKDGEGVFFYDSDFNGNKLLNSVTFGVQQDDVAWGRYPNGTGSFQFLTYFTPLSKNLLGPETLTAEFSADPVFGIKPLEVQFTDLSESNPNSWLWEFGDGMTSSEQNPKHIYNDTGFYSVTLKVKKDNDSTQTTKSNYIFVREALEADFFAEPLSGFVPLVVQFTDNSKGNPTSWYWSFGDDSSSTLQNPVHAYTTSGTFTVELTISDSSSQITKSKENYIVAYHNTGIEDISAVELKVNNYPNPFQYATNIEYTLPKTGNIIIKIYDTNGHLLRNLYTGTIDAGKHTAVWDGRTDAGNEVPNGMYMYRIQFERDIISGKTVVVR